VQRYDHVDELGARVGSAYDGQAIDLASKIEISDGTAPWQPVPSWAAFFLSLGESVALAHESGLRVTVVTVPPVRCFAAATAATAAVLAVACAAEAVPDVEEHFSALAHLSLGTAVVVKMGARIYAAKFAGVEHRGQGPVICVEYDNMTHYIPKPLCQRVQVGAGGKKTLPRGAPRSSRSDFGPIAAIIGRDVAVGFVSVPTVDVVLVGHVDLLSQELSTVLVRTTSVSDAGNVALAGLIRAARFLPEGGIHRSMLVSDRVEEFEMPVSDTPHVVVFDGARAFARYRTEFAQSSWIAILDRCSPALMEGAEIANEEFATRAGDIDLVGELTIPAGTEVQAFQRR
jgi:hypothetical protein